MKFVLDTNVYMHAIRDAGARGRLATWQEEGLTIVTYDAADFERIARAEPGVEWTGPFP